MQYIEPLPACDAILHLFENQAAIDSTSIYARVGGKGNNVVTNAISKLLEDGYIKVSGSSHFILGGNAMGFLNDGGYAGLCERYRLEQLAKIKKETEDKELTELNKEKIRIDLKNAKRIYRTYWITFAIAVGGLIISLILLIIKIRESSN